jgi:hypothetical protein
VQTAVEAGLYNIRDRCSVMHLKLFAAARDLQQAFSHRSRRRPEKARLAKRLLYPSWWRKL